MTPEKAASTSSVATEASKRWGELASLGEQIVTQLKTEESVDTLSRWMSHRLAELLQAAKSGDEEAIEEATSLILSLWSHRSSWPDGWPPPTTERLRRALAEPEASRPPNTPKEKSFLACLQELGDLQSEEYAIWLRLALVDPNLGAEIDAAAKKRDDLNEDERNLFDALSRRRGIAAAYFATNLDVDNSAARLQLTRDELRRLGRRRQTLLKRAIAAYEED